MRREQPAPAEPVVEHEPRLDHPARPPPPSHHREQQLERMRDPGRLLDPPGPLAQALAHQRHVAGLQVAQAAVQQLGRRRRSARHRLAALEELHLVAAARQRPGAHHAVDAGTDDRDAHQRSAFRPNCRSGAWPLYLYDKLNIFIMRVVNFSEARNKLRSVLDQVAEDADVTVITRRDAPDAVVMSLDTFNSLMETVHLLKSPANAAHLARSIGQHRQGQLLKQALADD